MNRNLQLLDPTLEEALGLGCVIARARSVQQAPNWAVPGTADDAVVISSLFENSKNSDVKNA